MKKLTETIVTSYFLQNAGSILMLALCYVLICHSSVAAQQTQEDFNKIQTTVDLAALQDVDAQAQSLAYLTLTDLSVSSEVDEEKAMLGVHVRQADETLREQLGINGRFGLVVEHVTPGSAAENTLLAHDMLYKFDGQILANEQQFQALVDSHKPGEEVEIEFFRKGDANQVEVELSKKTVSNLPAAMQSIEHAHQFLLDMEMEHSEMVKLHRCTDCHTSPSDVQTTLDFIDLTKAEYEMKDRERAKAEFDLKKSQQDKD